MKLETFLVVSVGLAYVAVAFGTSMYNGLSQWIGDGSWPPKINWIGLFIISSISALNAYIAYVSGRFSKYLEGREKRNGGTQFFPKPNETKTPIS